MNTQRNNDKSARERGTATLNLNLKVRSMDAQKTAAAVKKTLFYNAISCGIMKHLGDGG